MQFAARLFYELPELEEYFAVLDTPSSVPEAPGARPSAGAEARRRGGVRGRGLRLSRRPAGADGRFLRGRARRRRWRWSAIPAPENPPRWSCCSGCGTRPAGRILIDGQDMRDVHAGKPAPRDRRGVPGQHAAQPLDPRQSAGRQARRDRGGTARAPAGSRTRTSSSSASRRATTRWSASAAPPCRAASGSASRSRGRC